MADNDLLLKDQNATPASFSPESTDQGTNIAGTPVKRTMFGSKDGAQVTLGAKADAAATAPKTPAAWSAVAVLKAIWAALPTLGTAGSPSGDVLSTVQFPFTPQPGKTVSLTAGPTATSAPVALPACSATSYRARNSSSSASPVTWILTTDNTKVPAIPVPYSTAGTGGSVGDKTLDPGAVEDFGLTPAQQTALANGTLYLTTVTPAGGSAVLSVTPGAGA